MVRLPDVTDRVPLRRMSVAEGRVTGLAAEPEGDALAAAKVAAVLAAKQASQIVPALPTFQLTDAFCDLAWEAGSVRCTVTVQGYARTVLASAALAGACAALLALLEAAGHPEGARIAQLGVVQNVEG
jgi:cyclic pyranopterin phosphate synthase